MALEIARRFREMNAHVSFIGMIDTMFPSSRGSHVRWSGKVSPCMFLGNLSFWLYYFLPYWAQHYRRLAKSRIARLHAREGQHRILTVRHWLERYSPELYSGRVVFYRARAQGLFTAGPNKDLKKICSAICTVPGNHKSMMKDPHVRYLAEKINQELRSSASRQPDFCARVKTAHIL